MDLSRKTTPENKIETPAPAQRPMGESITAPAPVVPTQEVGVAPLGVDVSELPIGKPEAEYSFKTLLHQGADESPLYFRYPGQSEPQPAVVEINLKKGTLEAETDMIVGPGRSPEVHGGQVLQFGIPPTLSKQEIETLLEKIAPLVERVVVGADDDFDLTDDAKEAAQEINDTCNSLEQSPDCWPVENFLDAETDESLIDRIWEVTTREVLDGVARSIVEAGSKDGVRVTGDVEAYIRERVKSVVEGVPDRLEALLDDEKAGITPSGKTIAEETVEALHPLKAAIRLEDYEINMAVYKALDDLDDKGLLSSKDPLELAVSLLNQMDGQMSEAAQNFLGFLEERAV